MEIIGRGFKQIIQESPLYFHLGLKFAGYKLFNKHIVRFMGLLTSSTYAIYTVSIVTGGSIERKKKI